MPPKEKITRDSIIEAAFQIARERGAECVNARSTAERLGCSTQPVMYHFATMEDLKRAVYDKTDFFHTSYLLESRHPQEDPLLGIGMNYIRFAIQEPNLFRFLFQSGYARENSLEEMIDSEALIPVLSAMEEAMGVSPETTKTIFVTLALFVHGYASIMANHSLSHDESVIAAQLENVYRGAILAAEEENREKAL